MQGSWDNIERANLSDILGKVCTIQRQYGRSTCDLSLMVEGFAWALSEYTCQQVAKAISEYIKTSPDIPTPSDIRAILCPKKKPFNPDWAYYSSLKQMIKDGGRYALGTDEYDYINACEKHSLNSLKDSA